MQTFEQLRKAYMRHTFQHFKQDWHPILFVSPNFGMKKENEDKHTKTGYKFY